MIVQIGEDMVELPDGLSESEVDALVASHVRQRGMAADRQNVAQTFSELPAPAKAATGLGAAAAEPVLGLAQLAAKGAGRLGVPGADRAQQGLSERVNTIRGAAQGAGGWGTAGEIGGFVAGGMASLPRVLGRYLPQGVNTAQRVLRAGGLGAAEQGAYEGSRATLEGDPTRGQRVQAGVVGGGAGGAAGGALPSALGRIFEPVRTSPAARRLIDYVKQHGEDINLTAGQAAGRESALGALEEGLSALPLVGRAIIRNREGATEVWNKAELNKVLSTARGVPGSRTSEAGTVGIREAQLAVKDAYDQAVRGSTLKLQPDSFDDSLNAMLRLPPDDLARAEKVLENVNTDIFSGKVTGDAITRIRSEINEVASKAFRDGNYPLGRVLRQIDSDYQEMITQAVGPAGRAAMDRANQAYGLLADINTAAAMQGAVTAGGRFTPSQLISGQRRGEPASMIASARTPGLSQTVDASRVLGDVLPKPGPGTAEKVAAMSMLTAGGGAATALATGDEASLQTKLAGTLGPAAAYALLGSRGGARALTPGAGTGAINQGRVAIAEALRRLSPAQRSIMDRAGSRAGARTTEEDYYNAP